MHSTSHITPDIIMTGVDDRRLLCFEGSYSVPDGMSYNSYVLLDEKTVLFDTADKSCCGRFIENIKYALGKRKLDYIIVSHIEPDHSASLSAVREIYPEAEIVCSAKAKDFLEQFYGCGINARIIAENDTLCTGKHTLRFFSAQMVHWPEVMVTYDETDKVLFSADAFGSFGALNGGTFADETDFEGGYLSEARRYYCNIVGKYGLQVQGLLKKAGDLDISYICPLHGYVWRKNLWLILDKYKLWSTYEPEDKDVLIVYASVYGGTENAAEITSRLLREKGVKTKMLDVSVKTNDIVIAEAFRCSHIVFASPTYNMGIFTRMEEVLNDIAAHGLRNRTCAFIQNGTWAPVASKLMQEILSRCKNMTFIENVITVKSALSDPKYEEELKAFADEIYASL